MVRREVFVSLLVGALAFNREAQHLRAQSWLKSAGEETSQSSAIQVERGDMQESPTSASKPKLRLNKAVSVPATSRCIVIMVCQYMIVYVALAVCRTYHDFTETPKGIAEAALKAAAQTMTYGPMICVLFIACQMRVEFLSNGTDQPQMWVQTCMYTLTFGVMASTVLVLLTPCVSGRPLPLKTGTCDIDRLEFRSGGSIYSFFILTACRYLILLGLYGGLAGVIVGVHVYLPPGATSVNALPAPAPAVNCTMVLAVFFFAIQLVIAICRSLSEFTGIEFPRTTGIMIAAANTVDFAPMLSVLFLAARMRALQHDGQPQLWAQRCMFFATFSMCATTLLAIAAPIALAGSVKTDPRTKETIIEVPDSLRDKRIQHGLVAVRFLCMFAFFGGVIGVIFSILVFEAPAGPDATLPISPTVHCVINLTCQYFFVYALLIACVTVSELSGGIMPLDKRKLFATLENAKATLGIAPMLAILFVTTRMYALLITNNKGAPQAWVQDGIFMATWSLLISLSSCVATGFILDEVHTDEDGNVVNKFSSKGVAIAMAVLRYSTMLLLYGGIVSVIIGLLSMTPETANGRGSIPVISAVVNYTPFGGAPPGPGDLVS